MNLVNKKPVEFHFLKFNRLPWFVVSQGFEP